MKDIRMITGKSIIPEQNLVLRLLECKEGEGLEEILMQYETVLPKFRTYLQPRAAVAAGEVPKELQKDIGHEKMLYVLLTLGGGIDRLAESYFSKGDAHLGLLVNAMADASLFAFDKQVQEFIKRMGREEGFGVCTRLEAPSDLPIEMQKTAFDVLEADRRLGLSITSGYMLKPLKSMCYFLVILKDSGVFAVGHDCGTCGSKTCGLSNVVLKIHTHYGEKKIVCKKGSRLGEVLIKQGIALPMPCGGAGKCGKCKVKIKNAGLPVTLADRNFLTEEELQAGVRLACQVELTEELTVSIEHEEAGEAVILGSSDSERKHRKEEKAYGIAVDLGTTTLAFSLIGLESKGLRGSYACMNSQRAYGADVMSRIQASNQGRGESLKKIIQKDLCRGIKALLGERQISEKKLKKIIINGNTPMIHLLLGYSCQGLSKAPFTPVSLCRKVLPAKEVLGCMDFSAEVILPPGCSPFIGADITAGLFACKWNLLRQPCLFIDLGTNGEMALGDKTGFYTASTAVGPAFEGGNITFGMASVAGAVSGADMEEGKLKIHTIGDKPPLGICGTGVIEIVAELLKNDLIDTSGKLAMPYFETGFPVAEKEDGEMIKIYQKDIRQLQLAKGAVRAGIQVLLEKAGIGYDGIHKVFLAGGFGYYLDGEKAAVIGLLPKELLEKTVTPGNTSLKGGERYLREEDKGDAMEEIVKKAREVVLAKEEAFERLYVKCMDFP